MKYPRIPHVNFSNPNKDDIISNINIFGKKWIVTEKVDGAQISIEFRNGLLNFFNRNTRLLQGKMDRQFHELPSWIYKTNRYASLMKICGNRYIIFGEWLYHLHTIKYDLLEDFFVAFDMYDKISKKFISTYKTKKMLEKYNIKFIPILFSGVVKDKDHLLSFIKKSNYSDNEMEGLVLRTHDSYFKIKYVTEDFKNSMDNTTHWKTKVRFKNKLKK